MTDAVLNNVSQQPVQPTQPSFPKGKVKPPSSLTTEKTSQRSRALLSRQEQASNNVVNLGQLQKVSSNAAGDTARVYGATLQQHPLFQQSSDSVTEGFLKATDLIRSNPQCNDNPIEIGEGKQVTVSDFHGVTLERKIDIICGDNKEEADRIRQNINEQLKPQQQVEANKWRSLNDPDVVNHLMARVILSSA